MKVVSVRENPEIVEEAIQYFQDNWGSEATMKVYEDCISHCANAENPLPQWYLLKIDGKTVGCAGLITNDFISRMDLYPWICAVYIEEAYRGKRLGFELIKKAKTDAAKSGFKHVYLCTDHIGYYEKNNFEYIGDGYHPWGGSSRIYRCESSGI